VLQWLWVMTNTMVAFFMIHPKDAAGWKESSHASGSFGKRGLAPTNNHAERILRFGVLWRKRSRGTASEKGNRWVERILSVRHTCRLQPWPLFPTLIDALQHYFNGTRPDLSWIHA